MASKERYFYFFCYCYTAYYSLFIIFSFNWSNMVFFNTKNYSDWLRFLIWLNADGMCSMLTQGMKKK